MEQRAAPSATPGNSWGLSRRVLFPSSPSAKSVGPQADNAFKLQSYLDREPWGHGLQLCGQPGAHGAACWEFLLGSAEVQTPRSSASSVQMSQHLTTFEEKIPTQTLRFF